MSIFIKNICVDFADTSTYTHPNFQIIQYVVAWEYENLVTKQTLRGTIKTKQIENTQLVYKEIKAFIQEAAK